MRLPTSSSPVLLLWACALPAQQVLVVDAAGGAGSQFRAIAPAIAAAQPGDHVLVRRGDYRESLLLDKGIGLVGEPGTRIQGATAAADVRIQGITAANPLRMRGFILVGVFGFAARIEISDCAGLCALQDLTGATEPPGLSITRCAQVALRNLGTTSFFATDSQVVATTCLFESSLGAPVVFSGSLTLAGCAVHAQGVPFFPAPGIQMTAGRLVVTRSDVRANPLANPPEAAVVGTAGEVLLDPTATLVPTSGAPPVSGPVTVLRREVASLDADSTRQTATVDLHGLTDSDFVVIATVPAPLLPTPYGDLWLALREHFVLDFGSLRGVRTHTSSIPVSPIVPGHTLALQAAVLAAGRLTLSTPAVLVFPWESMP